MVFAKEGGGGALGELCFYLILMLALRQRWLQEVQEGLEREFCIW